MDKTSIYYRQVQLLVSVLPMIAAERCFALKGGTALNLFVRDLPRLSVDIDLAYLPLEDRATTLTNMRAAFQRIEAALMAAMPGVSVHYRPADEGDHRMVIAHRGAQIIVEASPVIRGSLFPPEMRGVTPKVEAEFGFAEIQVLSLPDLYGGKITAALDRQHPRDFFDVKLLMENEGLTREIMQGVIVYTISHPRPIAEVLCPPTLKDLREKYDNEFVRMPVDPVSLETLEKVREDLIRCVGTSLTEADKEFLVSFKSKDPQWDLLGLDGVEQLPAVRWTTSKKASIRVFRAHRRRQASLYDPVPRDFLYSLRPR